MENLGFEISETAHALRRSFDRRAATLGITRAQWKVLARISREPGLRQIELADRLDVEPITLCRIVDKLEEAGLVERQADPADRRAWRLQLTEKAQPLIGQLKSLAAELGAEAFAGLGPVDVERLRSALELVRANLASPGKNRKALGA